LDEQHFITLLGLFNFEHTIIVYRRIYA